MTFFNQAINLGADSIVSGAGILTKIYVRPEIFVFSATITSAINFIIGLIPMTVVLLSSGEKISYRFIAVFFVTICMIFLTTGFSLFLAVLYIKFDDSKSIMTIFLLGLQYMTPVFYPVNVLGPHTLRIIMLNPLTSYLQVFRFVIGGNGTVTLKEWIMMFTSAIISYILGSVYFSKTWPQLVGKL